MFSKPKLLSKHLKSCMIYSKTENINNECQGLFSRTKVLSRGLSEFFGSTSVSNEGSVGSYGEFHRDRENRANQKSIKKPFTVIVEGNIGSGKTTFLNRFMQSGNVANRNPLSEHVEVIPEPVSKWQNLHLKFIKSELNL